MESSTMKAWVYTQLGFENLQLQTVPYPTLESDFDIVVKVFCAGLNPVDYKRATFDFEPFKMPGRVGIDVCGQVHAIGKFVDPQKFQVGKTVVYYHGQLTKSAGAFGEYHLQDSRYLAIVPEQVLEANKNNLLQLYADLASIPCGAFTAHLLICGKLKLPIYKEEVSKANIKRIKRVCVTGGAGGVGQFCLQLLRLWRQTFPQDQQQEIMIITTCSTKNIDFVKSLGATHVIDYTKDDVDKKIQEYTNGYGVDAWVDLVGEKTTAQGLNNLAFGGELAIAVDNTDYTDRLFGKAHSVHNVALGWVYFSNEHEKKYQLTEMAYQWLELYAQKKITTKVEIITLEQVKDALKRISEGHTQGKIVMKNNF